MATIQDGGGRNPGFVLNVISGGTGDCQQPAFQIWWESVQRLKCYSRIKKFKMATLQDGGGRMAVVAILDSFWMLFPVGQVIVSSLRFKFDENRLNG